MSKHIWLLVLIGVLVALLLTYTIAYAVSFREIGIVTTFGKAAAPIEGPRAGQTGLRAKWPYPVQRLHRYDARVHVLDDTLEQVQTADQQHVLMATFCAWRIREGGAARFFEKVETVAKAEQFLRDIVRNKKGDVIGRTPLSSLLNTDPKKMLIPQIEREIRDLVQAEAGPEYGLEIVALGIKSFGLPVKVTEKVIESMEIERGRFAEAYRVQGRAQAAVITARAESARDQILAFANARAMAIRAEGDRVVAEMQAQYRKNEQLAIFLKELEFLRKTLDNTTFVGDAWLQHSLGFFRKGPSLLPLTPPAGAPETDGADGRR